MKVVADLFLTIFIPTLPPIKINRMNFLKKLFKKENIKEETKENTSNDNSSKEQEVNEATDTFFSENIFPKLKFGWEFQIKRQTVDGDKIEIQESQLPASIRIGETSLSIILVKDENQMVEWVKRQELNNISINEGIEKSFRNLLEKYSDIGIGNIDTKSQEIGKVGMIINASMYSGSLILLEQIWKQIFDFLGTNKVHFIVPNSRLLIFCDANNIKGNGYLYGNAKHHYNTSFDKISEFVYYKKEGEVIKELKDDDIEMDV